MTRNEFIENLKQEGFSEQQADRIAELQRLAFRNFCILPLNEELIRLRFEIEDLEFHTFGASNYELMINEIERYVELVEKKGVEAAGLEFESDYLNSDTKKMCARAAFMLGKAYETLEKGDIAETFNLIIQTSYYMGVATDRGYTLKRISEKASANAKIRHKENAELKQEAIDYYKSNRESFKNKGDAATYISEKIVPMALVTVRDWLKGV